MSDTDPFAEARAAAERAWRLADDYLAGLSERPVSHSATPEEMAAALNEPLPEHGTPAPDVVEEWFRRAEPGIVASSGPRFFGYVQGGTTPAALAGDWLASTIDQNAGMWAASPAAAQTEEVATRWLKELFDLPPTWTGVITSGATQANLVGLAAARQWAGTQLGFNAAEEGLGGRPAIAVISSTEIHASAVKALGTLGFGRGSVRKVTAHNGSVDLDALTAELANVEGPVIVIANAGEVNTGGFDRIDQIAELCHQHPGGAWLHVDGAFGLFAAASPRLAYLTSGIELADSVCSDAHKWLNVPYDSGFAFVRDGDMLRAAFTAGGAYVTPGAGWDPMMLLPEMSRRFRALSAWCALKAYGRTGYRELVERCVDNAGTFADWVEATPGVELMAPAPLNIVCFRYTEPPAGGVDLDDVNRRAIAALQADGRAFVTGTVWGGSAAIRAAFDHWATSSADVEILQAAVQDIGRKLGLKISA